MIRKQGPLAWVIQATWLSVYAGLRIRAFWHLPVTSFPDTEGYLQLAREPLFTAHFLMAHRAAGYPLLLKLSGTDPVAATWLQLGISIFSWAYLAMATRRCSTGLGKPLALGVVLTFSMASLIVQWDRVLLSESLSLSLTALFTAASLDLFRRWSTGSAVVAALVGFLWALTRDSNAYLLLMVALLWAGLALARRIPRAALLLCGFFVATFCLAVTGMDRGRRWVFPLLNVVGQRVLPGAESRAFFAARGMPLDDALLRYAGKWEFSSDGSTDPALQGFRDWFDRDGRRTYLAFLLQHPGRTLRRPVGTWEYFLLSLSPNLPQCMPSGFQSPLPPVLQSFIFPRHPLVLTRWLILAAAIGALGLVASRGQMPVYWIPLVYVAALYPHALLVFHGDAMETRRHALLLGVQARLAAWLLILFLPQALALGVAGRSRAQRGDESRT